MQEPATVFRELKLHFNATLKLLFVEIPCSEVGSRILTRMLWHLLIPFHLFPSPIQEQGREEMSVIGNLPW